jgi:YD repeat-containing protein
MRLRILLKFVLVGVVTLLVVIFGGPAVSGALILLIPVPGYSLDLALPADYTPLHAGQVDPATGLYLREDEDVVVHGSPPLILRRGYVTNHRVARKFGIGASHNGENHLQGDLREISLILAEGRRVVFGRTSPGGFLMNAMFEHHSGHEWGGSRLGWVGIGWALKRGDNRLLLFRGCGEGTTCSIVRSREADGNTINYRRAKSGRLLKMDSTGRWIAFEYDDLDRVRRVQASNADAVDYTYDSAGRLTTVTASDGRIHRYTYTDQDQIATIQDPDRTIENRYDANGRCIKQTVRVAGALEPLVSTFAYQLEGQNVVQSDMTTSDGLREQFTFNAQRSVVSEAIGYGGGPLTRIDYDRDPDTDQVTALTVTCPDRRGLPLRHRSLVSGNGEQVKEDIVKTRCYYPNRSVEGQ